MGKYLLFCILFSVAIGCGRKIQVQPSKSLIFWDVGQGDMATWINPGHCIFIDVGGSQDLKPQALQYLREQCEGQENFILISHFDLDHFRNISAVLRNIKISKVWVRSLNPCKKSARKLLDFLKLQKTVVAEADGEVGPLLVVHGNSKSCDENKSALVTKFQRGNALFTGDIPSQVEKNIAFDHANILKVAHHGSSHSSSKEFLSGVRPLTCIISAGKHNQYGHPHKKTLIRLAKAKCAPLRLSEIGSVKFEF